MGPVCTTSAVDRTFVEHPATRGITTRSCECPRWLPSGLGAWTAETHTTSWAGMLHVPAGGSSSRHTPLDIFYMQIDVMRYSCKLQAVESAAGVLVPCMQAADSPGHKPVAGGSGVCDACRGTLPAAAGCGTTE